MYELLVLILKIMRALYILQGILKIWGPGQKYRWVCEPVDYSMSEDALVVAKACYFYFLLKIADLADTVSIRHSLQLFFRVPYPKGDTRPCY